jgi:ubiquinone/menaquinone biosynthesis C-methylase UbiE
VAGEEQRQAIADTFDKVADTYDAVGVDFFKPIANRLVAELAPQPGERALDIGCGRGAALVPLAEAIGPSGRVVGIDLSSRMVEMTAADVASASNVEVLVGDAQEPDFPPDSFDVISSSLVIFFLPDPAGALQAWRPLLVEGGRLGISTFGPFSEAWQTVDEIFKPFTSAQMADARTRGREGPFESAEATAALVESAGFVDVRAEQFELSVRFEDPEHWYRWSYSVGQRRMWDSIPEDQRDEVRAEAFRRLDKVRDEHGRIGFDQQVRLTLGKR